MKLTTYVNGRLQHGTMTQKAVFKVPKRLLAESVREIYEMIINEVNKGKPGEIFGVLRVYKKGKIIYEITDFGLETVKNKKISALLQQQGTIMAN